MTTVVIPWRDDGHRARVCQFVCEFYRTIMPGIPVLLADSGHDPFNRAASRNLGIRNLAPTEVAVVADADTLPSAAALVQAIVEATNGQLHYPFTVCHYLTEAGTQQVLDGQFAQLDHVEFLVASSPHGETAEHHADEHAWAWDMLGYATMIDQHFYVMSHEQLDWSQIIVGRSKHR